jgi:hypothetical protein
MKSTFSAQMFFLSFFLLCSIPLFSMSGYLMLSLPEGIECTHSVDEDGRLLLTCPGLSVIELQQSVRTELPNHSVVATANGAALLLSFSQAKPIVTIVSSPQLRQMIVGVRDASVDYSSCGCLNDMVLQKV